MGSYIMTHNLFMTVCTEALSPELYVSFHQHESTSNGYKSTHGFDTKFL